MLNGEFFKTGIPKGCGAKTKVQTVVEGDIIIPDSKGDIKSVLTADAYAEIKDKKATDGRVSFGGDLNVNVLYLDSDGKIESVKSAIPFMDFINSDSLKRGDRVDLRHSLGERKATALNDRKINVRVMGEAVIKEGSKETVEVISGFDGDSEVRLLEGQTAFFVENEEAVENFTVNDSFNIPNGAADIEEILRTDIVISDKSFKGAEDRVTVRGVLNIGIIYRSGDGSSVEKVDFKLPFNGGVDIDGIMEESLVWGEVYVKGYKVEPIEDENGKMRVIEAEIDLESVIYSGNNVEIKTVSDVYSTKEKAEVKTEGVIFPQKGIFLSAQDVIKEVITIEEGLPEILQIKDVTATAEIEDIFINGEMVTAEGVLNVNMLYITGDDDEPFAAVDVAVPFENTFEVRGLYEDSEVDITAQISNVNFSLLSEREAEIRVDVDYTIFTVSEAEEDFVTEVLFSEAEEERLKSGITIYTVKQGDSLWSIAKAFNTTVEEILDINRIDDADLIYPGQRILILRRR